MPRIKKSSFRRLVTSLRIVPANEWNLLDEEMADFNLYKSKDRIVR